MTEQSLLNSSSLPYCRGCGHHIIAKSTDAAILKLGLSPLDIILVTDIGCHGIIDKFSNSHTVHGLHGRSVALASGISMGISNPDKKVIVFIGDGGVTIGMQHILEAIRKNIDMTVIIHNNMLYGMTGGQASGFTPSCFRTTTTPEESGTRNYDICAFARISKASYVRRIITKGDFSDEIAEAVSTPGFSLVEVVEACPSYGLKMNKGMKLSQLLENSGQEEGVWKHENAPAPRKVLQMDSDLFSSLNPVEKTFNSELKNDYSAVFSGSAGEAVQTAASFFAMGAMASGLSVNQRGAYPVTVGVGFSSSEIIISPKQDCVYYKEDADIIIVTSEDGLKYSSPRIQSCTGIVIYDTSLQLPHTEARIFSFDFRSMGPKNAALYAAFFALKITGIYPVEALAEMVKPRAEKNRIPLDDIIETVKGIESL